MSPKKSSVKGKSASSRDVMVESDDAVITRAFVGSAAVIVGIVVVAGIGYLIWRFTRPGEAPIDTPEIASARDRDSEEVIIPAMRYTDITSQSGITFQHVNGAAGRKLLPETMGGGVAFFDYDNDGDEDLLFVNSTYWPEEAADQDAPTTTLYQNDGQGNFTDVTKEAGLDLTCYGMGVAVGDFDNDGWRDVFISTVGNNHLFKNDNGKFTEVTATAGVAGDESSWSTSSGFFDYDRDGDLDLFVANYITWSPEIDLRINSTLDGVNRAYAPPKQFEGSFAYLYRNEGNGSFTDVSAEMGIQVANTNTGVAVAKGLGVAFVDCDEDGWLDIVVANDTVTNMLFHNQQGQGFEDIGLVIGIGVDGTGKARGAMGIDTAYLRNNQSLGIAIGNFANEPASLFVSVEPGAPFSDEEKSSGLGPQTRLELTFGIFFFDCDLDGRLDLFTANGHLEDEIQKIQSRMQYEQSPHLLWNAGPRAETEFISVDAANVGEEFTKPMVGRGAAYADIDNDGDLDIVITACGRHPRLLRNDQELDNHYLRVRVAGPGGNPDGIGATVIARCGDQSMARVCQTTRSYLSQCEPTVTFGLGQTDTIDELEIRWPDGTIQTLSDVATGQTLDIAYGSDVSVAE